MKDNLEIQELEKDNLWLVTYEDPQFPHSQLHEFDSVIVLKTDYGYKAFDNQSGEEYGHWESFNDCIIEGLGIIEDVFAVEEFFNDFNANN